MSAKVCRVPIKRDSFAAEVLESRRLLSGTISGSLYPDSTSTPANASGAVTRHASYGNIAPFDFGPTAIDDSTISGFVFNDANSNGTKDIDETGRSGVSVYLDANSNGQFDNGEATQATDQSGEYAFNDLPSGTFAVRIVVPVDAMLAVPANNLRDVTVDGLHNQANNNFALQRGVLDYVKDDLDGNGSTDIIARNEVTGVNTVWLMDGLQRIGTATLPPAAEEWKLVGTGDFNDDGDLDLLWQNISTNATVIWMMDGTTRTSTVALPSAAAAWRAVGVADWNGDGHEDIVWYRYGTGAATVWHMNGTALRQLNPFKALPQVNSTEWRLGAIGDFNGDNHPDLFWRNFQLGLQTAWVMDGYAVAAQGGYRSIRTPQTGGWWLASTADFNDDNRSDLLWINELTGKHSLWLLGDLAATPVAVTFSQLQIA